MPVSGWCGQQLTTCVAIGDPVTLGEALLVWRFCGGPFDMEQRLACGRELIDLGRTTGVDLFVAVGAEQLWWCHRELGELDEMHAWYEEAAGYLHAPDLEQRSQIASVALLRGDLRAVERQADALIEGPGAGPLADAYRVSFLIALRLLRGDHDPVLFPASARKYPEVVSAAPLGGLASRGRGS